MRRQSIQICLSTLALVVPGCVKSMSLPVHDEWANVPSRWASTQPTTVPSTTDTNDTSFTWWTALNDPLLDKLVVEALANSPTLDAALARVFSARASANLAQAGRLPAVTGGGSANRSDLRLFGPPRQGNIFQVGFDSTWELDLLGADRNRAAAASLDVEASIQMLDDAHMTLAAEVCRVYIELQRAQGTLKILARTLESDVQTIELTRSQVQAGQVSELDVSRAQAQSQSTRSRLIQVQAQVNVALLQLDALLSVKSGTTRNRVGPIAPLVRIDLSAGLSSPITVIERRPDVRAAAFRVEANLLRSRGAALDQYPRLRLDGLLKWQDGTDVGSGSIWSIGAGLTTPILDFGRVQSRLDLADARTLEALSNYRTAVTNALFEVESQLVLIKSEEDRISSLEFELYDNRESLELATLQYEQGTTTFLEVLDARRSTLSAELNVQASQAMINTQFVALQKAVGSGPMVDPDVIGKLSKAIRDKASKPALASPRLNNPKITTVRPGN